MIKPTKDYRMSKATKRMLSNFTDPHERGAWKNMMIQAELSAIEAAKQAKSERRRNFKGEDE